MTNGHMFILDVSNGRKALRASSIKVYDIIYWEPYILMTQPLRRTSHIISYILITENIYLNTGTFTIYCSTDYMLLDNGIQINYYSR